MKAAVLAEYSKFIWSEIPDPEFSESQVLVKVLYASICGSDQHIYKGDFHPRTKLPFIPGHEFGGVIAQMGKSVSGFKAGDRVAVDPIISCGKCAACQLGHHTACVNLKLLGVDMDGGFGQYVTASPDQLYIIPESIPVEHSSLVELYAIGFHANSRAETKKDDMIAIWGTGKVGHSICQTARTITNNRIFLIDILDERLKLASENYDNVITINARTQDPVKVIMDETSGRGVDVAFEAVGHYENIDNISNPVQGCIRSIRGAGTVCILGLSGEPSDIIFKDLIWREGKIVTSRNSHGEFKESITNLDQGKLQPDVMISKTFAASEAQTAFQELESSPEKYLKILLKMDE
jgi:threonine dehydrogenase-like Zn-dependent dehydrogenase